MCVSFRKFPLIGTREYSTSRINDVPIRKGDKMHVSNAHRIFSLRDDNDDVHNRSFDLAKEMCTLSLNASTQG